MKFKKFNKTVTLCAAISLLLGALCGCGNATSNSSSTPTTETVVDSSKSASAPNVVCTIFPEYDWVRNLDPDANVTMLLDNGVDLHSYQPTAEDLVKVANCDMFIYVGGESDEGDNQDAQPGEEDAVAHVQDAVVQVVHFQCEAIDVFLLAGHRL